MQDINKNLDDKLFTYLKEKEIGLFKYYQKFFFLPKYHNKKNFKNVSSFFYSLFIKRKIKNTRGRRRIIKKT